ncbi:MAG: c-type cytochrome [Rubrivivax sp.]|nr:c-type cytochrome [Rubrivivax sp.]
MSSSRETVRRAAVALIVAGFTVLGASTAAAQSTAYPGLGRTATPKEIAAWDIDVRPDFKGLPKGSGTVAQGMDIWESKCASCHGVFGESNEVFSPLVGGTTADDVRTGRVARLIDPSFPGRTTLMKVPTVSTLWDYIRRAMPWNAPKSLSVDEVYAVTAYLLNLGGVVPDGYTLSDGTMADAQQRLPNRNGMTTDHGLWPGAGFGRGKPDVQAKACMKDCAGEPKLASFLPDFARDAHGNLQEQNRTVGAQVGADTTKPPAPAGAPRPAAAAPAPKVTAAPAGLALAQKHGCTTCHGVGNKIVGPALRDVAAKHAARSDAVAYLTGKIRSGGSGVWGAIPMPAQTLPESDALALAQWLAGGAK